MMRRLASPRALLIGMSALAVALISASVAGAAPQEANPDYRALPFISSRVLMWAVAELHLMFAAFVLAVPMFALVIEYIGYKTGDQRYDALAYDFTKLLSVSFSFTATLGALLTFGLLVFYPTLAQYLVKIFSWTFLPTSCYSSSRRFSCIRTTTGGANSHPECTCSSGSCSIWSAPQSCSSPMPG